MRNILLTKQISHTFPEGSSPSSCPGTFSVIHRGLLKLPALEELRRNILLRLYALHEFPITESLECKDARFVARREHNLDEEDLTYLDENFPSITNFIPEKFVDKAPFIFEDASEYEESCIPVIIKVPLEYREDLDVYTFTV